MKMETLARRVAEKTGQRILGKLILGTANIDEIPDGCIIWHGKRKKQKQVIKQMRDYSLRPYIGPAIQQPRAIIRFNKKDIYVHRLLIEAAETQVGDYEARSLCGTPFCVNPKHWVVEPSVRGFSPVLAQNFAVAADSKSEHPAEQPPMPEDEWPDHEVEEMVDRYININPGQPINPNHNLLLDIPGDQLRSVVTSMGLERLL